MNAEPIITVDKLHKWFGMLHVLQGVSLSVMPREVVVMIGRSGSGKSTFLRCLNFLEQPSAGTIAIDGLSVTATPQQQPKRQHITALRLRTGMVFQEFNLFPHMTALQNVIEGLSPLRRCPRIEPSPSVKSTWKRWACWTNAMFIPSASPADKNNG
jgi:polar amino acid transport system ATP-binding protein